MGGRGFDIRKDGRSDRGRLGGNPPRSSRYVTQRFCFDTIRLPTVRLFRTVEPDVRRAVAELTILERIDHGELLARAAIVSNQGGNTPDYQDE